jgi:hypothetical protein
MNLLEFYPTPIHLVDKMANGIDFNMINTVFKRFVNDVFINFIEFIKKN